MIRLIVNADDLGAGHRTDRGIFEAYSKGIVTCASVLPNGPSFTDALREADRLGLPLGVHLNLSEGRPLTGAIAGLTDAAGGFPGKYETRKRLMTAAVRSEEILDECLAQIDRILSSGCAVSHLDTHQHVFLFHPVTNAVIAAARSFAIRAVRLPDPAENAEDDPPGELGTELALYRRLAPAARKAVSLAGLLAPDALWGMPLLNRLDEHQIDRLLQRIPHGTWELMVHPGYLDEHNPFSGFEREHEVAALTSRSIRERISKRGIELISYGDLSCAS